jgi:hypothetical protein
MTWPPLIVLASSVAAIVANVAAQIASHVWVFPGGLVKSLLAGVSVGLATLVAALGMFCDLFAGTASLDWGDCAAGLVIYLAASFTFLCLVASTESSVRFQILRELHASPRGLTLAELDQRYSDRHIVAARLERLLESGAIERLDGAYRLRSRSLLVVAWAFLLSRKLLFGVASEFEAQSRVR